MICDKDCFNCKFPDCILDDSDAVDERVLCDLDKQIEKSMTAEELRKQKQREYGKRYYQEHKEECRARAKEYQRTHRWQVKQTKRKWYINNKERVKQQHQEYYRRKTNEAMGV